MSQSYTVQALKFYQPISELMPQVGVSTVLDEHIKGWSATVDEDRRVVMLKVRKTHNGKVQTLPFRVPFESLQWYRITATKVDPSGDPPDPK